MRSSSVLTVLATFSSALAAPTSSDPGLPLPHRRPLEPVLPSPPKKPEPPLKPVSRPLPPSGPGPVDPPHPPIAPRAPNQVYDNNDILNLALILEYIQTSLYQQGLANYTQEDFCKAGFDPNLYANLQAILANDQAHVTLLQNILGEDAVAEGAYTFPSTDAYSFIQLAAIIEGAVVSAYINAAANILPLTGRSIAMPPQHGAKTAKSPGSWAGPITKESMNQYVLLDASALAIESYHNGYLRAVLGFPSFPKNLETPLGFNATYSLASEVTRVQPSGASLPFVAFPKLLIAPYESVYIPGVSNITYINAYTDAIASGLVKAGDPIYAIFYSGLGTYSSQTTISPNGRDLNSTIPTTSKSEMTKYFGNASPEGQVYVLLSSVDGIHDRVQDSNTISGVGVIEVQTAPMEKKKRERVRVC